MQIKQVEYLRQKKLSDLDEIKNQSKLNSRPLVLKRSSQIDPDYILKTQESHNKEHLFEKNFGAYPKPLFQYLENMTSSS